MTQPLILLTTDFSPDAARAYPKTVEMANRIGGRILLLHVVEATPIAPHGAPLAPAQVAPDTPQLVKDAEKQMAAEAPKLGSDVPVETLVTHAADVVDAIVRVAGDRGAAYIAISTHGRTGLRRLVLGSVAEAVVRHAKGPVVCFPGH